MTTEDKEVRHQARNNGLLQERLVDRLDLCLYMSEKEVAVMAFPLDGRFDYLVSPPKINELTNGAVTYSSTTGR